MTADPKAPHRMGDQRPSNRVIVAMMLCGVAWGVLTVAPIIQERVFATAAFALMTGLSFGVAYGAILTRRN